MSGPDIFISYNREDAAFARIYADAFTAAGLTVWWDATLRSGEDYDAVTEESLRTAKAVVVLWSPRSVNSRWVRAEATIADRGQTLMPVMIEACDRPVMFELKQTAELSHWRGDHDDPDWLAFVADVRRKVGRDTAEDLTAPPPPRVPVQPKSASLGRSGVAVLPFGWRGSGSDLELLAEDLTEDLTRELSYNGFFKVIAAGTMAAWRGKTIDHKDLGQRLDARFLVEGRLQRSGGNTRLTAQLIDGHSGNVLWSMRMATGAGGEGFSPEALAVAVGAQFAEQIVLRDQARAMARPAPWSAWDHILRAAACARRADEERACQAVAEARLAVAAAPDVGLAHAMLASALAVLPESQGVKPDEDQIREIQSRTRQAMRLDGNNPTVLMELAGAYQGLGEYDVCLRLAKRIVELWPSSPASYRILGDSFRMLGQTRDAVEAYRQQERLSPFDAGRNVGLTHLGICLMLEGQGEEAEQALDRALMLDPENPVALEWKAIVADSMGKGDAALATMRQIRSSEQVMPLDRHVWQIERNEHLRERTAAHVATLRRLWRAAGDDAPEVAPPPRPATTPVPERAHETVAVAVKEVPVAAAAEAQPAAPEPMILAAAAKGGKVEPLDGHVFAPEPANDRAEAAPVPTRRGLPHVAMIAGALLLVGGGAAAWIGGLGGKSASTAPTFALATAPSPNPGAATAVAAGVAALPASAEAQPIDEAVSALIAVSRSAKRPAAELAALEAGQRAMAPLLAQIQSRPGDAALTGQVKTLAAGLVQQQGPALSADADRLLHDQQQIAASGKGLAPDSVAKVDRTLGRARGARAEIAASLGAAGSAPDALSMLVAQRSAVAAYVRLQSVPISAVVASARAANVVADAAVNTAKMQNRLSKMRVEIEGARGEVMRLSGQVTSLAQVEKAGLFASGAKRQSHKLRKDNADRARALAAEADRVAASAGSSEDLTVLNANLARVRGLSSQVGALLVSSKGALKSGAAAEPTPTELPTRK